MLKSIDLFSGIGGIAHALRGLGIEPVAYCEREPWAIAVLRQRMRCGDLPPAPIHTDVQTFPGAKYKGKVHVLAGGFPCTGLSSMKMAQRDGFNNPGTGLFRDVIRLIEEIQPNIVFLENVAVIRLHGLKFVAETLRSRGYDVSWVSLKGFNVGAPQHRPRWFCLATRTTMKPMTLTLKTPFRKYNWTKEPCARMVLDKTMTIERNALLGNSVIPDLVRWAFLYLWTGSRWKAPDVLTAKSWPFIRPDVSTAIPVDKNEYPTAFGMVSGKDTTATLPAPVGLLELPKSRQRIMDPSKFTFEGPRSVNNTLEPYTELMPITTWATPRHSNLIPSRVLTRRTILDLPTQVRFAQDTPDALRSGTPNPEFLEWLMGFPRGWTNPFGTIR